MSSGESLRAAVPISDEIEVRDVRVCATTKKRIDLCYQTYGHPRDPCVVAVCGLGVHLGIWDPDGLTSLAARGFYVVVFDNRDSGKSTKFDDLGSPSMVLNALPAWLLFGYGRPVYHLSDMADDGWALLDRLGVGRAHVLGVSMGGMIAQCMALARPDRTLTLTCIMTTTGSPRSPQASWNTMLYFLTAPKSDSVDDLVEFRMGYAKNVHLDPAEIEEGTMPYIESMLRRQTLRNAYRDGLARQSCAVTRAPCRERALRETLKDVPCLVVHGDRDRLIPYGNALRLAGCLPRCRLETLPGHGHFMLPCMWDAIVAAFDDFVANPPPPRSVTL